MYKGKKGHATAERHIQALEKVVALVPAGREVVLLGDAEYDTIEMIAWVEKNTSWRYVLRTSPQIYVQAGPINRPIRHYPLVRGKNLHLHQVGFTKPADVILNVISGWDRPYEEPIFLVTNLNNSTQACRFYRKRFHIETFFSDQKSRGFQIHQSHLSEPARLSCLLIAACLAYLWMIDQGLQGMASNQTQLIDRTERVDKSLFRLRLDWIKCALKHQLDFQPVFYFRPFDTIANLW